MDTVAAGKPLIDFVELCQRANRPPLLVGHRGVGKSDGRPASPRFVEVKAAPTTMARPREIRNLVVLEAGRRE